VTDPASTLEIDGDGIALFTMRMPKRLNAMGRALSDDLIHMTETVRDDKAIGALIVTGSDGVFSAGGDITEMKQGFVDPAAAREYVQRLHIWTEAIYRLEVPVIMAVDGVAYGGGFSLALVGDFILASSRAAFSSVFGRIGLVPDLSCLYTLPRLVGLQRAKELVYSARRVDAEEALALGIAYSVHAPDALLDAARGLARRLRPASRTALGLSKTLLNQSLQSDYKTMVELELGAQALALSSPYHKAAITRFLGKEPATFDWDRDAPPDAGASSASKVGRAAE
jgi:2-(1,2-epoxy-1,2-dihydrophenyl)acetyl-CoA isomerase